MCYRSSLPTFFFFFFFNHLKHSSVSYCRDSFGAKVVWHILSLTWWASWVLPTKSCHFWAFPLLGISTSWCRNCFPQRLLGPSGAALIFPTSGFSWAVVAAPAWCSNSSHQARCRSDTDKRSVLSLQASLYFSSHLPAPSPPCINLHVLDFNSFWYSKIFVCSHFSLSSALQQLFRGCHWQLS